MIHLHTPNGFGVEVPENQDEDTTPKFDVNLEAEAAVKYYKDNGYVIFSGCVSNESCEQIRNLL